MKILQINKLYYPTIGGIETVVKDIAEGLNKKDNITIDVLVCQSTGKRTMEIINGINIYKSASFGKLLSMPLSLDFFKLFFETKNNYDLFIVHYPFPLASLLIPFIPKEKLLIYYHCDIVRQKIFNIPFIPFIKIGFNRARKILVSGKNIIKFSPLLKKHKDKCEIIPFGIDINFTHEDYIDAAKIKSIYSPEKIILSIGRLVYYKGFEYAIKSMKQIEAKLLIIGEGSQLQKLNDLIEKLNLKNKVYIIPPQPRLSPYLLASDIFLFPSTERSEAFGLVQIEAMAAGLPIINTYLNTGVEEVSLNEISGLTIKPKDEKAISEAINKLLNDQLMLTKYGENSKKRYQDFFTKEVFLNKLLNIIVNLNK